MKYSQLKTILTKNTEGNYRSLSNLYKPKGKSHICLAMYESSRNSLGFRSYYKLHLEIDYYGKILTIKDDYKNDQKLINKYKKIIGTKIDLNSFKWDYEKIVHNRPVGVESSYIVGQINKEGVFIPYNKKNVDKISFPKTYRTNGDRLAEYGGHELTIEFTNFVKKYKKQITSFDIYKDSITFYRLGFNIRGIEVSLDLQQFFNYELKLNIYHPQKGCLSLEGDEILEFDEKLSEIKNDNFSPLTKVQMITRGGGTAYRVFQDLGNGQIQASIKFDGYNQRPKGVYTFVFDLKRNKVECLNGQKSLKFIPKQLKLYKKSLSTF